MTRVKGTIEQCVRRRIQLAASMAIGLILLVVMFVLQPEYSRASDARTEMGRLGRESSSIGATESMLRSLMVERDRRHGIERSQLRDIPRSSGDAGISDVLALNVDDGGATSWSVRLLPPEEIETGDEGVAWMSLPAIVEMNGRFEAVIDALGRVESSDRLVRVRSIRISRARNAEAGSGEIEATIDLDTVFTEEGAE